MFLCIIFFLKLSWRPTSANPRRRSLSVAVEVRFTAAVQRWGFDAPTINNGWCPIHWQKQSYLHVQPIWIKLQQIIFFISYQRRAKMRPWMAIGLENPAKTSVLLGSHHLFFFKMRLDFNAILIAALCNDRLNNETVAKNHTFLIKWLIAMSSDLISVCRQCFRSCDFIPSFFSSECFYECFITYQALIFKNQKKECNQQDRENIKCLKTIPNNFPTNLPN